MIESMLLKKYLIGIYEQVFPIIRTLKFEFRYRFEVMTFDETIAYIKENNCSVARYGDGEFGIIMGTSNPDFQEKNDRLANRLRDICRSSDKRVLICIPHNFKKTDDCNDFAKKFWDWWIWEDDHLVKIAQLLELSRWKVRLYGDAQITRPYMDWKDKSKTRHRFDALKSLWAGRDVLIVEGTQTKLGIGNDLFDNVKSLHRVLAPAENAFAVYNRILTTTQKQAKHDTLILIALGPTATVLAYDLGMLGFQALDIGHIDIEYEWFLKGVTSKTAVTGKYTQEAHTTVSQDLQDYSYSIQIVDIVEGNNDD